MKTLLSFILNGNRVLYDYTGTEEGKKLFMEALLPFHKGLSAENNVQEAFRADPVKNRKGCAPVRESSMSAGLAISEKRDFHIQERSVCCAS